MSREDVFIIIQVQNIWGVSSSDRCMGMKERKKEKKEKKKKSLIILKELRSNKIWS